MADQNFLPDGWVIDVNNQGVGPIRYVVKTDTRESVPTLKLRSKAYYDVQQYVFTGMNLPKDATTFQTTLPQDQCEELAKIDDTAYGRIRDALVGVQNHCFEFNATGMSVWTITATNMLTYAKYALDQISGRDNLTMTLAVMVDPKYRDESSHDQQYRDAAEVCQSICEDLRAQAEKYEKQTADGISKLIAFQNVTVVDKGVIDKIQAEFDGTNGLNGWSAKLNSKLAALRKEVVDKNEEAKRWHEGYDQAVIMAATSPTYAWAFPVGTLAAIIVASVYGAAATKAKSQYEAAEKQALDDKKEIEVVVSLINYMLHMSVTVNDLDQKMELAISAMTEIKDLFNAQKVSLGLIAASMGSAKESIHKNFVLRKRVLTKFEAASKEWRILEELTTQFLKSGSPVVVGVDQATAVGSFAPSNVQAASAA